MNRLLNDCVVVNSKARACAVTDSHLRNNYAISAYIREFGECDEEQIAPRTAEEQHDGQNIEFRIHIGHGALSCPNIRGEYDTAI